MYLQPQQTNQQSSKQQSNPQIYLTSPSFAPTQTQTWYRDSGASHHVINMSQNIHQTVLICADFFIEKFSYLIFEVFIYDFIFYFIIYNFLQDKKVNSILV